MRNVISYATAAGFVLCGTFAQAAGLTSDGSQTTVITTPSLATDHMSGPPSPSYSAAYVVGGIFVAMLIVKTLNDATD